VGILANGNADGKVQRAGALHHGIRICVENESRQLMRHAITPRQERNVETDPGWVAHRQSQRTA
jgi:hypothetical protein